MIFLSNSENSTEECLSFLATNAAQQTNKNNMISSVVPSSW